MYCEFADSSRRLPKLHVPIFLPPTHYFRMIPAKEACGLMRRGMAAVLPPTGHAKPPKTLQMLVPTGPWCLGLSVHSQ